MATKASRYDTVEAVQYDPEPTRPTMGTLRFRMPGLFVDADGEATLEDVPLLNVNMSPVSEHLHSQGLEQKLVDDAIEVLAQFIHERGLAEHFVKRMKVTGHSPKGWDRV